MVKKQNIKSENKEAQKYFLQDKR